MTKRKWFKPPTTNTVAVLCQDNMVCRLYAYIVYIYIYTELHIYTLKQRITMDQSKMNFEHGVITAFCWSSVYQHSMLLRDAGGIEIDIIYMVL